MNQINGNGIPSFEGKPLHQMGKNELQRTIKSLHQIAAKKIKGLESMLEEQHDFLKGAHDAINEMQEAMDHMKQVNQNQQLKIGELNKKIINLSRR